MSAACHRPAQYRIRARPGRTPRDALPDGRQAGAARVGRGRQRTRRARPVRRPTSSMACAWPRPLSNGAASVTGCPRASRAGATPGREPRLQADLDRRLGSGRPAPRTSAARRPRSGHRRRRPPARTRTARGSAAGRRRPWTRRRSTAGARRSRNSIPGRSVWSVRLPGSRTFGMGRVQAEVAAPVLVVDPGLRIDDAGAEAEVVRLDQADRVAVGIHGREVDRPATARVRGVRRRGRPPRIDARRPGRHVARRRAAGRPGRRGTPGRSGTRRGRPSPAWPPRSRDGSRPGRRRRPARTPRPAAARTGPGWPRSSSATSPELFGGWVVTRTPR